MLRADVVVVGAGPAGSAAAITATRAGVSVLVVDRAGFPRDKCCGDGLTTGALRRLERLGLDPAVLPSWQPVGRVGIRIADGRVAELDLPGGAVFAATVPRLELDAALVALARRGGAIVQEGRAATGVRPVQPDGEVEVTLDDGDVVRARYVVGADGMWSPLRKALGLGEPGYLGEWHAMRQYVRDTGPKAGDLWVWFDDDLRPGYAWSFPLPGGRANVGFGVRRAPGRATGSMKQQWADLLRRPYILDVLGPRARPEGPAKAWPIPTAIGAVAQTGLGGRVLFAGDAARAGDCMTGEGIAQALETGELAARTLTSAGPDRPGRAAAAYRFALRRGMALDDRVSALCSRVLASRRGSIGWFPIATASARRRELFARWMFEDVPRGVVLTPWRWQPGMLHRPGAFAPTGSAG